ncbi:hypothetical protein B9Z50_17275, partial [Limnohabitans sp. Bal53]
MLEPARDDIQALMETYSAQQLGGTPTISMPLMGRYVSSQAATAGASTFPVDAILHDAATLAGQSALRNTTLQLGPKEILGGSGDLSIDLVNTGLVSPGYSPGVLDVDSFTQLSGGSLLFELGGTTPGSGSGHYDQLNVRGEAVLAGTLEIDLLDGFKPSAGETFTIMTYGSVSGSFDHALGLYVSQDDIYFEIEQTETALLLRAVAEIAGTDQLSVTLPNASNDVIGEALNLDYFGVNGAYSLQSDVVVDELLRLNTTTVQLSFDASTYLENPISGEDEVFNIWSFTVEGAAGFVAKDPLAQIQDNFRLTLSGVNLGLSVLVPAEALQTYGWVVGAGVISVMGSAGAPDMVLSAADTLVTFDLGFGSVDGELNQSVINLTTARNANGDAIGGWTIDRDGSASDYRLSHDAGASSEISFLGEKRVTFFDFLTVDGDLSFDFGDYYRMNIATGISGNQNSLGTTELLGRMSNALLAVEGVRVASDFTYLYDVPLWSLAIGGSGLSASFGFGDYDFTKSLDEQDFYGFAVSDFEFGMGIFGNAELRALAGLPVFYAASGFAAQAGFATGGSEALQVSGQNLQLNVNDSSGWLNPLLSWTGTPVIDFGSTFESVAASALVVPGALLVRTGAKNSDGTDTAVQLDFDGNQRLGVSVEDMRMDIAGFIHAQGSFNFEKGPQQLVTLG